MNIEPLLSLAERWREEASLYRRRGRKEDAAVAESYADELEHALRAWCLETLSLEEAAHEAGTSYEAMQKRVARGQVPNAGESGRPRVRRCDLHGGPRSPAEPLRLETGEPDIAEEILSG